jgi:DNA repair exonuclease SbcCD nuclease subunit
MRIIHLADTHLGFRQFSGRIDPERGINQRESDVYTAWSDAVTIAVGRKPDIVIHAGDLFDSSRPTPLAIAEALDGFARLREHGIPVIVIAGNHSTARFRSAHGSVFQILERFGVNAVWSEPRTVNVNGIAVHACPHESDAARLSESVANLKLDPAADANVLVLHAGLEAVRNSYGEVNEVEIDAELLARVEFDYIALGHLHRFQTPQVNAVYPGSLERLDFNDLAGDKAVLEIDLAAGAGEEGFVQRFPLQTRPMVDLTFDCRDLASSEVMDRIDAEVSQLDLEGAVARTRLESISRDAYQSLDFRALDEMFEPCLHHVFAVGRTGLAAGGATAAEADLSFAGWARGRVPDALDEEAVISLARRYLDDAAAEEAEAEAGD